MGKVTDQMKLSTHSPASSSSSQDFEFTISLSPCNSTKSPSLLCSADEVFFKGQLLPLQPIATAAAAAATKATPPTPTIASFPLPRPPKTTAFPLPPPPPPQTSSPLPPAPASSTTINVSPLQPPLSAPAVPLPLPPAPRKTTTVAESNGWTSDTTSSRDSNSSSCDSSRRPSSVTTEEEDATHLNPLRKLRHLAHLPLRKQPPPPSKAPPPPPSKTNLSTLSKKMSKSAKQVFQKYIQKMNSLYEKISRHKMEERFIKARASYSSNHGGGSVISFHGQSSLSFSGNLKLSKRKNGGQNGYIGRSCPSSMRSSPSRSGVLGYSGEFSSHSMNSSSMEELNSAIQGAIAHCKSSISLHDQDDHCEYV